MFIWDPNKAIANFEKHAVSFEEAATVFTDEDSLDWPDLVHSTNEPRRKRLGMSTDLRLIILVYTVRNPATTSEKIRLISARRASKRERLAYEKKV